MWKLKLAALLIAIALMAGCGESQKYIVGIKWSEKHSAPYLGTTTITENGLFYEDRYISIGFTPILDDAISFVLLNKTGSAMRLIWDETAFIHIDGSAQRVMHSGVRYIDRNSYQPPSVIPPGATLRDIILPTENVYYVSGQYGGWRTHDIIPQSFAPQVDGFTIGVLMPIEVEGRRRDYTFYFDIVVRERR